MKIENTYSFKGGEDFIKKYHPAELQEVIDTITSLDAISCLTKESKEKTKVGKLLLSPIDTNYTIKHIMYLKGWTQKAKEHKKKVFAEPRHSFGKGRFREMDGVKNKVGLEVQFGKYAFMGYDIFSKMIIFKKLGYIECGIEIVPSSNLVKHMSTGVSSFDQIMVDFKYRGESNIDIPVFVLGIDLTKEEQIKTEAIQKLFKQDRDKALKSIKLRVYDGTSPGPKPK